MSIRVRKSRLSRGANIAELKNNLSVYLKDVKDGGEVIVSERNVPFAKIVPLNDIDDYDSHELRLIAEGRLRPPETSEPLPESFWEEERPSVPLETILRIIREDRDAR
jgi:prevent-host-death family protein